MGENPKTLSSFISGFSDVSSSPKRNYFFGDTKTPKTNRPTSLEYFRKYVYYKYKKWKSHMFDIFVEDAARIIMKMRLTICLEILNMESRSSWKHEILFGNTYYL